MRIGGCYDYPTAPKPYLKCKCENGVLTHRLLADGTKRHWIQCSSCLRGVKCVKDELARTMVRAGCTIVAWDPSEEEAEAERAKHAIEKWEAEKKEKEAYNQQWHTFHEHYLGTPKWAAIRALVLKRDSGICQGCFEHRAMDVHHKTYDHLGDELAFELVSLCRSCHEKVHAGKVKQP